MPVSIRDVIDFIAEASKWFEKKRKETALRAWSNVKFPEVCYTLTNYYESHGITCYSYPTRTGYLKVPLFVLPQWENLTEDQLDIRFNAIEHIYNPTKAQKEFLEFFQEIHGLNRLWNGRIFRLTNFSSSQKSLRLDFVEGHFFDSIMCQYILEHELLTTIAHDTSNTNLKLPLRDKVASSFEAIEDFCKKNVVRIGIST